MGKIVVSDNVSLDGVIQDPAGDEGFRVGGWVGLIKDRPDSVDELRLKIFPVVLGAGKRLFGETSDKKAMRLVDTQTVEGDVVFLTYERLRDA
jgi:dihydrofolate reductase